MPDVRRVACYRGRGEVVGAVGSSPAAVFELDGSVGVLTLRRPEALNAINGEMSELFDGFLAAAAADDAVRAMVVVGTGRAFCAGADIKQLDAGTLGRGADPRMPTLMDRLRWFPKPTVAAVNGLAVGGGVSLALACDVRLGCEASAFELNFVRVGIVPEGGLTYVLPRMIGWSRSLELLVSGRRIDADEAVRIGLVQRLVDAEDLVAEATAWAADLGKGDLGAVRAVKELMEAGADRSYVAHRIDERQRFFASLAARRAGNAMA